MFGKKKSPNELCKEWTRSLKKEMRQMDRRMRKTEYSERKMKVELKKEAIQLCRDHDRQRYAAVRIMAKSIIQMRNQYSSLRQDKEKLNSVILELKEHCTYQKVKVRFQMI